MDVWIFWGMNVYGMDGLKHGCMDILMVRRLAM